MYILALLVTTRTRFKMSIVSPDKAQRVAIFIDVEVSKRRRLAPFRCFPISFSTFEYKSRDPLCVLDKLLIGRAPQ